MIDSCSYAENYSHVIFIIHRWHDLDRDGSPRSRSELEPVFALPKTDTAHDLFEDIASQVYQYYSRAVGQSQVIWHANNRHHKGDRGIYSPPKDTEHDRIHISHNLHVHVHGITALLRGNK